MKIGIFLGHPAQFHLFKFTAQNLRNKGYSVEFLVKRKDILEDLVQETGINYTIVRKHERKSSRKLNMIWEMLKMDMHVMGYIIRKRPRIIIGTYCPIVSRLFPVSFIVCNEDDADVVPRFAKLAYPAASAILTPISCDCGKWNEKAIKYAGFQKLAYLHPNRFTPDKNIVEKYLGEGYKPYILMRFAKLNAHHDGGVKGMTDQIALNIIKMVERTHQVLISSERPLSSSLESYRLRIDPMDVHHLMSFADLYLGDSQSMAVEAAMLGVPNIRFNDFVARIGVLNELENNYQLTNSISSTNEHDLYAMIGQMLCDVNTKATFKSRRNKLIKEKIDVTAFMTWFVEDYPESKVVMKKNPDYQYNFR